MYRKAVFCLLILAFTGLLAACGEHVPPATLGRVKTVGGWSDDILPPGKHTCYGRDVMYLIQNHYKTFEEKMEILVSGKVNLSLTVKVTARLTKDDKLRRAAFDDMSPNGEDATYKHKTILLEDLYSTFLKLKVESIPRQIVGSKQDVAAVTGSRLEIANQVRKGIIEAASTTPLEVTAVEITNYDWPDSVTKAQEELAAVQLREAREQAIVSADLAKAKGRLRVEEAEKLVEIKKAEAVAESIMIINNKLKGAHEYLRWHEIRMLSEAATGPNNAFIITPYGQDTDQMAMNAQLRQMMGDLMRDAGIELHDGSVQPVPEKRDASSSDEEAASKAEKEGG